MNNIVCLWMILKDFSVISKKIRLYFLSLLLHLSFVTFGVSPSTQEGYVDIPLADHLLTTSAITAAMVVNYDETGKGPQEQSFRLVSGDFSGIQNFIFSLSGQSDKSIAGFTRTVLYGATLHILVRCVTENLPFLLLRITTAGGKFRCFLI